MFVDASVMIAILTGEDGGEIHAGLIEDARRRITSVMATWEASVGLFRKTGLSMSEARAVVREFVEVAGIEVLPVEPEDEALALAIFETNGRNTVSDAERNRALNMADCFHYAVARRQGVPILTKDAGFLSTGLVVLGLSAQ